MVFPERPIIARNPWLIRTLPGREAMIAGLMLHSTRSGKRDGDDGPRTERWWANPVNIVRDKPPWGSYADLLIYEDGTRVLCTDPDREYATWTAGYGGTGTWAAGIYYIQIELAQGTLDEPFTDALIDSLAEATAMLARRYDFPIARIPFLAQTEWPPPGGIADHEHCANGRKHGKSDPGPLFPWETYLARAGADMGGTSMDEADRALLYDLARRVLVGSEYRDERYTDEQALAFARERAAAWRESQSVLDVAESARVTLQRMNAVDGGGVPEHAHDPGPVRR